MKIHYMIGTMMIGRFIYEENFVTSK